MPKAKALATFRGQAGLIKRGEEFEAEAAYIEALKRNHLAEDAPSTPPAPPSPAANTPTPPAPQEGAKKQ